MQIAGFPHQALRPILHIAQETQSEPRHVVREIVDEVRAGLSQEVESGELAREDVREAFVERLRDAVRQRVAGSHDERRTERSLNRIEHASERVDRRVEVFLEHADLSPEETELVRAAVAGFQELASGMMEALRAGEDLHPHDVKRDLRTAVHELRDAIRGIAQGSPEPEAEALPDAPPHVAPVDVPLEESGREVPPPVLSPREDPEETGRTSLGRVDLVG